MSIFAKKKEEIFSLPEKYNTSFIQGLSNKMLNIKIGAKLCVPSDRWAVIVVKDKPRDVIESGEWIISLDRIPNTAGAAAKEYFMSAAQKCTSDGSGRFLLDDVLRDHLKLNRSVVFVGVGRVINIWSEELWRIREANRNMDAIRAVLEQYEL